jgi:hypothetical protein
MATWVVGDVQGCKKPLKRLHLKLPVLRLGPRPPVVDGRYREPRSEVPENAALTSTSTATVSAWCSAITTCTCWRSRAGVREMGSSDTLEPRSSRLRTAT